MIINIFKVITGLIIMLATIAFFGSFNMYLGVFASIILLANFISGYKDTSD